MKRLCFVLLFFAALLVVTNAHAAGTVTVTRTSLSFDQGVLVIKLACVGDAADGSIPDTTITKSMISAGLSSDYYRMGFYIYEIWTVAGAVTAPDAADMTIVDDIGAEMYSEENVIAATGVTEGDVDKFRTITGPITVSVANQDTVDATWDIYIKLVR